MSDLREKISDLLDEWRSEINEEATAYDWGCRAKTPDSPYEVADRILALLPKVPELPSCDRAGQPTHWRPLPAPPAEGE